MYSYIDPVTVDPLDTNIYIGLSGHTPYTSMDASVEGHLSTCTSLSGPVATRIDIERQCQFGASGRFVYVYTHGGGGDWVVRW